MQRRALIALPLLAGSAQPTAAQTPSDLDAALARFKALSGQTSFVIDVSGRWRAEHRPDAAMFVGSAIKTFILATYLREVEAGRLSEDEQLPIDAGVRSPSSPVLLNLTGTTSARAVLEAMIAHSDNTATDAALARVGVDRVRAFINEAGLRGVLIPDSTRRLFSWIAGAAPGSDLGWAGIAQALEGKLPGTPRPPINDQQSMIASAATFVAYYQQALAGRFFAQPGTLREFKRIQAMADAIAVMVPPDTVAYGKGGSIDWQDFHALCVPGQMLRGGHPVTFCFTLNWQGPDSEITGMMQQYKDAVAGVLAALA